MSAILILSQQANCLVAALAQVLGKLWVVQWDL